MERECRVSVKALQSCAEFPQGRTAPLFESEFICM